ncbi:hypothetical protein EYF80_064067 [Liparis tanakae]|uniref:Uncharacterized protein n=1 Tax=Liparis tanakae TaxID=230148 RepID=A0A4Z2EAM0_9TELE|nr:hypothetical protein EYF80_064067 [Liparis tanakae]
MKSCPTALEDELPDIRRRLLDWTSSSRGSTSKMEPGSVRHAFRSTGEEGFTGATGRGHWEGPLGGATGRGHWGARPPKERLTETGLTLGHQQNHRTTPSVLQEKLPQKSFLKCYV